MADDKQLKAREKYVLAFNKTMTDIWREKIALLGAVDTGALYNSVVAVTCTHDGKFLDVTLSQEFLTYGIFVNYGTGKEVYRGNPGDIAKRPDGTKSEFYSVKRRKEKAWFSPKYYMSVNNLQEFYADNLGEESAKVIALALNPDNFRLQIAREE